RFPPTRSPEKRHRYQDPWAVPCPECGKPVHSPYGHGRAWHLECWAIAPGRPVPPETLIGGALRRARELILGTHD
ncbi:MAG: hypothetical protein O2826_10980, partial [Chloroflexi bacterium]|nr:hypothetical protein [Chloroflexota bacterium]